MQAPGYLELTCYQGATFDYSMTWKVDGTAVNLTSYTARMQVRETYDSTDYLYSLTSSSAITLGGTAGTIRIQLSAAETAGVASGQYAYDLELVSSGSVVTRLVQGPFFMDPEVTR